MLRLRRFYLLFSDVYLYAPFQGRTECAGALVECAMYVHRLSATIAAMDYSR